MPSATAHRVFVVDDSAAIRERVTSLLEAHELQVVGQAESPPAAIDGIRAMRPDAVVLDMQLLGGSGLQVLQTFHAEAPRIAFVVFTNVSDSRLNERFLRAGASHVLDKSLDFQRLAMEIERAIAASASNPTAIHRHSSGDHHVQR